VGWVYASVSAIIALIKIFYGWFVLWIEFVWVALL
jgi:hypothetical protein